MAVRTSVSSTPSFPENYRSCQAAIFSGFWSSLHKSLNFLTYRVPVGEYQIKHRIFKRGFKLAKDSRKYVTPSMRTTIIVMDSTPASVCFYRSPSTLQCLFHLQLLQIGMHVHRCSDLFLGTLSRSTSQPVIVTCDWLFKQ